MIEAPHYSASGTRHKSAFALPAELFDGTVHEPVLHQAIKTQLANRRQGTAKTKTRSFVSGGNQKPWRQKGTGRARQGSIRSPLWRGGGIVFGPEPRDYRAQLPRKMRQLARRSAFNARAREGALLVVDGMNFDAPKTQQLAGLLEKLGLDGKKVLVLSHGLNRNLYLSGRNLPSASVMSFADASAYDVLWSDAVVVEQGALGGGAPVEPGSSAESPKPAAKRIAARVPKQPAKPQAKKPAAKAKKPAAAKKPGKPAAKRSQVKPAAKKKKKES
jgi:large subunit ribosomal protein L4